MCTVRFLDCLEVATGNSEQKFSPNTLFEFSQMLGDKYNPLAWGILTLELSLLRCLAVFRLL